MITKRSFLRGSGGLLGCTLLNKYFNNFESYGKGLIDSPQDFKNTLFVDPANGWFELGSWDITEWENPEIIKDELPNWFEYLEYYMGEWVDPNCPEKTEHVHKEYGVSLVTMSNRLMRVGGFMSLTILVPFSAVSRHLGVPMISL